MAVSPSFDVELKLVNRDRIFKYVIDPEYGENEWSVSGLTVTAGSDAALEHGASEALYQLGYRFYDPNTTIRPATVPASGVSLPRQHYVMPYIRVFENYGRGGLRVGEHRRWLTLNCIDDRRRHIGHTWERIIKAINEEDGFFKDPKYTILHKGTGPIAFNLALKGADRAALVDRLATYLAANLNPQGRISFDPEDGDKYNSDQIVDFANEVVTAVRAIVPGAKLGIYAYPAHGDIPKNPCPHLYVQVALGFDDLGIGYQAMVREWSKKAGEIALRGYGDIAAWFGYLLCNSGISRSNFFRSEYPGYIANGANSLNMETSGNWVKNIVSHYHMIRFCKTGTSTYEGELAEIVENVYGGDKKVADLFQFWGEPVNRFNEVTLGRSMEIVEAMQPGAYKDRFKQYLCICYNHWDMTPDHQPNGLFRSTWTPRQQRQYWRKLEHNLHRVQAMGETGYFHSYGFARRLANSNTWNNGRRDLTYDQKPHWVRQPVLPNDAEFAAAFADIKKRTARPAELNYHSIDDLVVVDTAPKGLAAAQDGDAVDYVTTGPAKFVYSGPGTITVTYLETWRGVDTHKFGPGLHEFHIEADAKTTWSAGVLFLSGYPNVQMEQSLSDAPKGGGHHWMYNPKIVAGGSLWYSKKRITVTDAEKQTKVFVTQSSQVGAGVLRVDKVLTRGEHLLLDANPFFSSSAYKMLMPKALARVEFSAGVRIDPQKPGKSDSSNGERSDTAPGAGDR